MNRIPQNLSELSHFLADPRVQFKEEVVNGVEVVIPHYMISDSTLWSLPFAKELRGHTYLKSTGELIGVAFHKFFNVGEKEETLPHNIDWDNCVDYTFDKMDGSMINAVCVPGENGKPTVHFKTKKSFYSDVAVEFNAWFWSHPKAEQWASDIIALWERGYSPIFEFYHPDWQIVLNYGDKPKMWWLNTRCMNNGEYYDRLTGDVLEGINCVSYEVWGDFKSDMHTLQQTVTGVEGWVVYDLKKNEFYKVKTKWYLDQHRVRTQMRERDVAEMAAKETLDDVKTLVTEFGFDLSKIEAIEKRVADDISFVRISVETLVNEYHLLNFTAKDAALKFKDHPNFGMSMNKFRGKEPNYVEYFLRNILKKKYGLKNVYNEKF